MLDTEPFEKLWQNKVFDLPLRRRQPQLPDVQYVSDLAYVDDFASEFPDWPAA